MDFPEVLHPDERLQFWIDINDCSKYAHLCRRVGSQQRAERDLGVDRGERSAARGEGQSLTRRPKT